MKPIIKSGIIRFCALTGIGFIIIAMTLIELNAVYELLLVIVGD